MMEQLKIEWQTIGLAILIYSLFALVTWNYHLLPAWLVFITGGYLVAWQGSLRHEATHMHPTNSKLLNELLILPSLDLYLPFRIYLNSHQQHHNNPDLTIPRLDPESYYIHNQNWDQLKTWQRFSYWTFHTLAGRLLLYPFWMVFSFIKDEAHKLLHNDYENLKAWIWHLTGVTLTLSWVIGFCAIPFLEYVFLFVYPGLSLTLLRSFAEHRPHEDHLGRSVILEAEELLGIIYLYNNYHALHHNKPEIPWYQYKEEYLKNKEQLLKDNHHYFISGYRELFLRYLFNPKEKPYLM